MDEGLETKSNGVHIAVSFLVSGDTHKTFGFNPGRKGEGEREKACLFEMTGNCVRPFFFGW